MVLVLVLFMLAAFYKENDNITNYLSAHLVHSRYDNASYRKDVIIICFNFETNWREIFHRKFNSLLLFFFFAYTYCAERRHILNLPQSHTNLYFSHENDFRTIAYLNTYCFSGWKWFGACPKQIFHEKETNNKRMF